MLKTLSSKLAKPKKRGIGLGDSNKAGREPDGNKFDGGEVDGGGVGDDEIGKKVQKMSKSKKFV